MQYGNESCNTEKSCNTEIRVAIVRINVAIREFMMWKKNSCCNRGNHVAENSWCIGRNKVEQEEFKLQQKNVCYNRRIYVTKIKY